MALRGKTLMARESDEELQYLSCLQAAVFRDKKNTGKCWQRQPQAWNVNLNYTLPGEAFLCQAWLWYHETHFHCKHTAKKSNIGTMTGILCCFTLRDIG